MTIEAFLLPGPMQLYPSRLKAFDVLRRPEPTDDDIVHVARSDFSLVVHSSRAIVL